jgi:hypothetical protein
VDDIVWQDMSVDTTPPTVAITAPAPGASVSELVTVTASASDNAGVAGVRFQLDGNDLGSEVNSVPFALDWITASASNGPHTLTAIARDAAGNRTTSSPVSITVTNAVPSGPGFSLRYFGNGVNAPDLDRVKIRVDDPSNTHPSPPVNVGATDITIEFWLRATATENFAPLVQCGANNNWIFGNIVLDRDRFNQDRSYGVALGGGLVVFGVTGAGTGSRTICGTTSVLDGQWHHIAVQRRRSDGQMSIFVDGALQAQAVGPGGDISYPFQAVPGSFCGPTRNQPCTNSDPFLVIGAEKHDAGTQYPSFSGWVDELRLSTVLRYGANFTPPTQPFTPDANTAALYHFDEGQNDTIIDSSSVQVSRSTGVRRLGGAPAGPLWSTNTPFNTGPADTIPPSVAISSPENNATVGGTITVTASATDNIGVAAVQFLLNSAPLGAEVTAPPFSVQWDTTTVANGVRTLTATARDAAGNRTTSGPVSVTVVNNPVPVTTSLNPGSAVVGGPSFTLTVNGSGFVNSSVVRWNGSGRTTTFVSATQLTAAIPDTDIAALGTAQVTVFNPAPGGGTSNAQTFAISAAAPVTVTFDNPPPPGAPNSLLSGTFQGISFGTGQWRWSGPFGADPTNNIYFASASGTSRSFTFSPGPRLLVSVRAYTTANGTLTLTDDNGQTLTRTVTTGTLQLVTTSWTRPSTTVTVTFTAGWALGVDDIAHRVP